VYREVTKEFTARRDLVTDAHLAALLRQHEIRTLYTTDADFRKFEFLDVRYPFVRIQVMDPPQHRRQRHCGGKPSHNPLRCST